MIAILVVMHRPIAFSQTINGGLAGLVAICAGANILGAEFAIIVGTVAALVTFTATEIMEKLRLDDAVGAVGVHGFAGAWGTIAVGLFNPETFFQLHALYVQLVGVAVSFVWTFPTAYLMFKVVNSFVPLRVSQTEERRGLDYSEHYEQGYPEFQTAQLNKGTI
jgi:Amt family ammonium transporter